MKPAIRRHTADSRTGRSMISPGMDHRPWAIPKETTDHNAEVDRKKAFKKEMAAFKPLDYADTRARVIRKANRK